MEIDRQYAKSKKEKQLLMKIDALRLKFMHLLRIMGNLQARPEALFEQVMHHLGLVETLVSLDSISPLDQEKKFLENVTRKCKQVEVEEPEDFNFSCNVLILGKTGVGKSSTINSIFEDQEGIIRSYTNPFRPATKSINEISGMVDGVHLRVFDTPGLKISLTDQIENIRRLKSIKKHIKNCPPDIVLYVDRIDTQTLNFNDLPMLRSITSVFGSSIWLKTIVALTHAAFNPPDGPDGSSLSYEIFVAQRSHAVQQSIWRATAYNGHINPLALVENHLYCKRNKHGERVLPNDISWRSQLLLQCYSLKILSEVDSHFKLDRKLNPRRFGLPHSPLPVLLSYFLQSKGHLKALTHNLRIEITDLFEPDIDLYDYSVRELLKEDDLEKLPPFKPKGKSSISKLTIDEKKAYFFEYDYRVKLLQKKKWMDRLRVLKGINKRIPNNPNYSFVLNRGLCSFVSEPSYLLWNYILPSQTYIEGALHTKWDNSYGLSTIAVEQRYDVTDFHPVKMVFVIEKEKNLLRIDNIETTMAIGSDKLDGNTNLLAFKVQSIKEELACMFMGETKWKNSKQRNTCAGISVSFLGENIVSGFKLEKQALLAKNSISLVGSTGIMINALSGESLYGVKLDAHFNDKSFPMGMPISTCGFSACKRQGDLSLETNMQYQFSIGKNSKAALQVTSRNLSKGSITIKTTTSHSIIAIFPVLVRFLYYFYSKILSS